MSLHLQRIEEARANAALRYVKICDACNFIRCSYMSTESDAETDRGKKRMKTFQTVEKVMESGKCSESKQYGESDNYDGFFTVVSQLINFFQVTRRHLTTLLYSSVTLNFVEREKIQKKN